MTAAEGLFLAEQVLRSRRNVKWTVEPGVLPAFVAEMDFAAPPPVHQAIARVAAQQDYGYPKRPGFERPEYSVAQAFADRMARLYGWQVRREDVQPLADLVQATFAAVMAWSDPGDAILLQTPAYPPFYNAIAETGRRVVPVPMRFDGTRHVFDLDAMERLAPGARMILLCNPHNPTGRVLEPAELQAIAAIAERAGLVILSDEIHSDIVYAGRRHVPIASLSDGIAARTVTINSPTKAFNIPGLRAAVIHFGSADLRETFLSRLPRKVLGQIGVFGIEAAVAAWRDGDAWLAGTLAHLQRMRDLVAETVATRMPGVGMVLPEATYLAWLDCSGLGLNGPAGAFFAGNARVNLSPGEDFAPGAGAFVRLNFATSEPILREILDRMAAAVAGRRPVFPGESP